MKKGIIFLLLILMCTTGCSFANRDKDGSLIGISNESSTDLFQVKVIIDSINIREHPRADSNKLGVVVKDSIYTVLDVISDDNYYWFHIKTNNNIEGYIASNMNDPYVEYINRDYVDITKPIITIDKDNIDVSVRSDINDDFVHSHVQYSDDYDKNPKFEYEINFDDGYGPYYLNVKVTDESGNSNEAKILITVVDERKMKDNKWLTYNEFIALQNKATTICQKYTGNYQSTYNECEKEYAFVLYPNEVRVYGPNYDSCYCLYDLNFNAIECSDNGNNVSYNLIKSKIQPYENKYFPTIKKILDETKLATGYEYSELSW